jgi:hypothetical protein
VSSFLIYKQNKFLKFQLRDKDKKILQQSTLLEASKNRNLVSLMSNILGDAEQELKNSKTLSDDIIARIADLSLSLKPYRYLEGDSLSEKEISPERGQLLLTLIRTKLDSSSFIK